MPYDSDGNWIDEGLKSPWEKAHESGQGDKFDDAVAAYYEHYPTGDASGTAQEDTNWLDSNTWAPSSSYNEHPDVIAANPSPNPDPDPSPSPNPNPDPAPSPDSTNRTRDFNPNNSITQGAVAQSRNPQLDQLMTQLIANQKIEADRRAREAEERAAWRNQMRGNIMDRYNKASAPVDENDPIMSQARQVYDAEGQRSFNVGREAMAARDARQGTPAGASDAYLQSSSENLAKGKSAYSADLMMKEYDKRRQEIGQLLNLGANVLTADENRMLQEELGTIDAEIRQLGLSTNAFLGGSGLQNQRDLGFAGLDLQRYGIDTSNQQFYDKMSNDNGLQEALMNQMIMQQLMGV